MTWIDKFIEMLFSLKREHLNIEGAYILKHAHLPKSIFKYREVNENSIRNLENDTVWLADPNNFNDPYDCAHTIDYKSLQTHFGHQYFNDYLATKGPAIELSVDQKEILSSSADPFTELIEILLKNELPEKQKDIKAMLLQVQKKMYEDLSFSQSKSFASSFKLCSFSENNNSMLMWAHYASYHQGFCIEYSLENLPYSDFRRRFLYPVIYSDKMFDATEHFKMGIDHENFNNLHLTLAALIKAKDWSYEKEWRLVFAHGVMDREQAYKIGKPKAVYLGTKINQEDQDKLIEICTRRDIPFFKMKADHEQFYVYPVSISDSEQYFFKVKT